MRDELCNCLADAPSPYLRLHAANPVAWQLWGETAFARARDEDKPIFLSIGYYTCHWCHVMERESFADPALAALLNRDFIPVKVDREERPDIDRIYMAFVQATTGGGGWPLSVFLAPNLRPFYGGTYFPPRDLHSTPSFARLLNSVSRAWREDRARLLGSAADVAQHLERVTAPPVASDRPDWGLVRDLVWPRLFDRLVAEFDPAHGGFGAAPKFPRPVVHAFLLRYARLHAGSEPAQRATDMVLASLRAMALGGIHDHLAGGFHRYATDAEWRVPHFEKMLYDQALLTVSYLEAWQLTQADFLAATARRILDFVLYEMTNASGGFYSAQDADSPVPEAHRIPGSPVEAEGAYYLFTRTDLDAVLDAPSASLFAQAYHIEPNGNVPASLDRQGEFSGKNILYLTQPLPPADPLASARKALYAARRARPHPPTDDKIITAWNGLMLSAFSLGASALGDATYLAAAQRAARYLEAHHWHAPSSTLFRRDGATGPGFVEDYAFLIQGLLDLHQADFDPHWLDFARALQHAQDALFAAPEGGYFAAAPNPELFLRLREDYDGAEPSANSVAVSNLLRLALWFEQDGFRQRAERTLASFSTRIENLPEALPLMVASLSRAARESLRLQIAGDPHDPATLALLGVARRRFSPDFDVVLTPPPPAGGAAAFLCEDFTCQLPISDPVILATALDRR